MKVTWCYSSCRTHSEPQVPLRLFTWAAAGGRVPRREQQPTASSPRRNRNRGPAQGGDRAGGRSWLCVGGVAFPTWLWEEGEVLSRAQGGGARLPGPPPAPHPCTRPRASLTVARCPYECLVSRQAEGPAGPHGVAVSLCSMAVFSASWGSGSKARGVQAPLKPTHSVPARGGLTGPRLLAASQEGADVCG